MEKSQSKLKNIFITALLLILSFFLSVALQDVDIEEHITTLFVFAVFVVSLSTDGYWYGISAAIAGIDCRMHDELTNFS